MYKQLFSVLAICLSFAQVIGQNSDYQPGVLEVSFRSTNNANEVQSGANPNSITPFEQIKAKYGVTDFESAYPEFPTLKHFFTLRFTDIAHTEDLINDLKQLNEISTVDQLPLATLDGAIPIDADGSNMWYLQKINRNGWDHWKEFEGTGRIIKIAIVDCGVRLNHEDIREILYKNPGEIPDNGIDDDLNGYIDDVYGYDVSDKDGNANPPLHRVTENFFSHGTKVAGLSSASTNNGIGIASLGLNTRIIPVKCIPDDSLDFIIWNAWDGMRYAIAAGADIINCSWSQRTLTEGQKAILNEAISRGIIIVASAGNHGGNNLSFPAAYDGVIAVGATNDADVVWTNSNYGSYIDVMAPGENIYTTTAASDHSYGFDSGTSFSAPIVSGFIGLLLSQENDPERVISILKKGCDEIDIENPGKEGLMGAGRINIDRTLELLMKGDPSGLINFNSPQGIVVFPNPSKGIVRVAPEIQMLELRVVDLSGREVARVQPMSNSADLREFHLRGLYIVQVQTNEGLRTARVSFQ